MQVVGGAGVQCSIPRRSAKPMPVNPLTGEVLGRRVKEEGQEVQGVAMVQVVGRRPPGGAHSQLW